MKTRMCGLLFLLVLTPTVFAEEKFFLRDGQRVVFLGDSNTFAGGFIAYLDAYLVTRFPEQKFTLINLGLPSETVSGLSEPDHPYPRPNVHERLERALTKSKPDIVVACYGMNDGIYHPFAEERLKKYQEGVQKLIAAVEKVGAKVVLMTPAPFDGLPIKGKLLEAGAEKYSYMKPYVDYDGTLTRYAEWLVTLRDKYPVIDPHTKINDYLKAMRKDDPKYFISGDGIHPNAVGHWLIAQTILKAWDAPADVDRVEIDVVAKKIAAGKADNLKIENDVISWQWTSKVPCPMDSRLDAGLLTREQVADRLNRYRLYATGAKASGRYELYEEKKLLGHCTPKQLTDGLDLLQYKDLSAVKRSAELWKLVEQRQKVLGLAWLTDVGHKRPDTPKGIPLADAATKADDLEKQIRKLAEPTVMKLRLEPASK